jgi:tRNA threonylcarbamoyladenosine biosynthesis protein TsaE
MDELSELAPAADLLLNAYPNDRIFCLNGKMGAGKTTFIKAVCERLGVTDKVSSPTFSLVNEYAGADGKKIFHFDFYRIKDQSEALDMGYEDYLYSGAYCFIEWPEKIRELLPQDRVELTIAEEGEKRSLSAESL